MKRIVASILIALAAVAPSTLTAQDSASTKGPDWFKAPNTLRLYAPTQTTYRSLNSAIMKSTALNIGPKTDMGVQPGCPMPRVIPDTTRVTAMPHVRLDTTVDARVRVEVGCGRK